MSETINTDQIEEPVEQASAPGLTLQDLILMAQIIQLGSGRGTFKAEELETVGALYAKMVAFLEANGAVNRVTETEESGPSESEE